MPELPEVETIRIGIESVVIRQTILQVHRSVHPLRGNFTATKSHRLEGQMIKEVQRRGKYLLLRFANQEILMIHLGMSGQLLIDPLKQTMHDHMLIVLSSNNQIVYRDPRRFGMLAIYEDIAVFEQEKLLGPDGNSPKLTAEYLKQFCQNKKKTIKALLMDQKIIAGIGNIYASEILFVTQVSPFKTGEELTEDEYQKIAIYTKNILQTAITVGGTSLKDYRQVNGNLGYFQQQLKVYNKAGALCNVCKHIIERCIQAGRATFYCPKCQEVERI